MQRVGRLEYRHRPDPGPRRRATGTAAPRWSRWRRTRGSGSTPWNRPRARAQLGGVAVGIAVEVDVAQLVAELVEPLRRGWQRGLVGVEPHLHVDLRRVVPRQHGEVGAQRDGAPVMATRPARRTDRAWAGSPSASAMAATCGASRARAPASIDTAWMWVRKSSTRSADAKRAVRAVGQHVVRAGQVVAHAGRGVGAQEHRPGAAHQGQQRLGAVHEELQVLGRHHVGDRQRLVGPVHQGDVPARAQGGLEIGCAGARPPPTGRPRPRWRRPPPADHVTNQARPSGPCSAWTTTSIAAHATGGVGVGDHDHLRGPGERGRDPHHPRHLALGLGHVAVAGPGDDVDGPDRLRAERHGRHGLGPAHPVDLVDPGDGGGRQGLGRDGAVGPGGHAQHELGHARHPGRGGAHEHGRGIARPAPRGVQPGPPHRPHQVPDHDPVVLEVGDAAPARGGGRRGCGRRRPRARRAARGRSRPGRRRGPRSGTRRAPTSTPSNRRVRARTASSPPAAPRRGWPAPPRSGNVVLGGRARQRLSQLGGGHTTQVEALQGHGHPIVLGHLRPPALVRGSESLAADHPAGCRPASRLRIAARRWAIIRACPPLSPSCPRWRPPSKSCASASPPSPTRLPPRR